MPTQGVNFRGVQQLARCAVGFAGVEAQLSGVADYFTNEFSNLLDSHIDARADIDMRCHGFRNRVNLIFRQLHDVHTGIREIIHVQKFTHW